MDLLDVRAWAIACMIGVIAEVAEVDIAEVEFGSAFCVEAQSHAFVGEGLSDVIEAPFVGELAVFRDGLYLEVGRVEQRFVILIEASSARLVKVRRALLVQ